MFVEHEVTVRLNERRAGVAFRHDARWLPWSWVAFDHANDLLAAGRDRATRSECLADIHALFGTQAAVTLVEDGAPPSPLRRAVRVMDWAQR